MEMNSKRRFLSLKMEIVFCCSLPPIKREIACVGWRFWLGAQSNIKAGEGRETARRLERLQLENYFSRGIAARAPGSTKPPCYAG